MKNTKKKGPSKKAPKRRSGESQGQYEARCVKRILARTSDLSRRTFLQY